MILAQFYRVRQRHIASVRGERASIRYKWLPLLMLVGACTKIGSGGPGAAHPPVALTLPAGAYLGLIIGKPEKKKNRYCSWPLGAPFMKNINKPAYDINYLHTQSPLLITEKILLANRRHSGRDSEAVGRSLRLKM